MLLNWKIFNFHGGLVLPWGVVIGSALIAAIWDVRTGRIPNWLTGLLLLSGFVVAGIVGGRRGLLDAGGGCLILGLPYVLLFIFAGGGAGDAKLMGALGTWLGVWNSVPALLAVSISGGLLGIAYAAVRRRGVAVSQNLGSIAFSAALLVFGKTRLAHAQSIMPAENKMLPMPYGLAILLGMCAALAGRLLWHA